jgi:tRNA-guanine family transglycosylase
MGVFLNFCAGADDYRSLPGKNLDGILFNVPNAGKSKISITKTLQLIESEQPRYVMLDSGGFSLLEAELNGKQILCNPYKQMFFENAINLTPRHVVDLAVQLNPQFMVALDYPIGTTKDPDAQQVEFKKKIGFTVLWALETAALHQKYCPHIQLFLPIQCYNLSQLAEYFYLVRDLNLENLCMPVRNLSLQEIVHFVQQFWLNGARRIHLLGVGSLFHIAMAVYMAKNYFEWFSVDAQTWRIQAQYSRYLHPLDLKPEFIGDSVKINPDTSINCPCPWCAYQTLEGIRDLPYTDKTHFLMRHNYWVTTNIARELYEHANSLWEYRQFLRQRVRNLHKVEELYLCLTDFDLALKKSAS